MSNGENTEINKTESRYVILFVILLFVLLVGLAIYFLLQSDSFNFNVGRIGKEHLTATEESTSELALVKERSEGRRTGAFYLTRNGETRLLSKDNRELGTVTWMNNDEATRSVLGRVLEVSDDVIKVEFSTEVGCTDDYDDWNKLSQDIAVLCGNGTYKVKRVGLRPRDCNVDINKCNDINGNIHDLATGDIVSVWGPREIVVSRSPENGWVSVQGVQ